MDNPELAAARRRLARDGVLDLRRKGLTEIPQEVFSASRIYELDLRDNYLTSLPPEIGALKSLRQLELTGNLLTELPPEICLLQNLTYLGVRWNRLTKLPREIGLLDSLEQLYLTGNLLTELPESIGSMENLVELHVNNNQLQYLPHSLARLSSLRLLDARQNAITNLVPEMAALLTPDFTLKLEGNPLAEPLPELMQRGTEALLSYLTSLADAVSNYEAKLLLVGEGNVGKTSLVASLAGEEFVEGRDTTHGIEIHPLSFVHPENGAEMTLRAWDFGGQEVYRITHQFFFSRRALYLLVWHPREGRERSEVEGWLKRIHLRVGNEADILIVATHCDERQPELDYPTIKAAFPDLVVGNHAVDNRSGTGISRLRDAIVQRAAGLPQMGQVLSARWVDARDAVLSRAALEPQILYSEFREVCKSHNLDETEVSTLAELMHDLGHIIYYGNDEGLRDVVVLNPEWLTKAIGYVLEDPETRAAGGILDHARLKDVWGRPRHDGPRYDEKYYPYFLRLMEKFDVSYRLEDDSNRSLVAQLVPHERPTLPWERTDPVPHGVRSISLVCSLGDEAPGLISWLTVRHHDCSIGKHWRTGVFLRHPVREYASEALIEVRNDLLYLEVRAPSPDMFFNVLRDSLEGLLRKRWPGLFYELFIPCPTGRQTGETCDARFPLRGLIAFRERGGVVQNCLLCQHDHDVNELLTGFSLPRESLQPELIRIQAEIGELATGVDEVARVTAEAAGLVRRVAKAVSIEVTDCPRLFTFWATRRQGLMSRLLPGQERCTLTLWCEHPGAWHAWPAATYEVVRPRQWVVAAAPYLRLVLKTLQLTVPIVSAVGGAVAGDELTKRAEKELELMNVLVSQLPREVGRDTEIAPEDGNQLTLAENQGLRAFRTLLFKIDPARLFGDLRRVQVASGEFLWVCPLHYDQYDPGLPTIPV